VGASEEAARDLHAASNIDHDDEEMEEASIYFSKAI
jgi:hypothetical protein